MTATVCVIFSNNQLKDLPDELASLHLLREIAISYNRYNTAAHFMQMGGGLMPVKQWSLYPSCKFLATISDSVCLGDILTYYFLSCIFIGIVQSGLLYLATSRKSCKEFHPVL